MQPKLLRRSLVLHSLPGRKSRSTCARREAGGSRVQELQGTELQEGKVLQELQLVQGTEPTSSVHKLVVAAANQSCHDRAPHLPHRMRVPRTLVAATIVGVARAWMRTPRVPMRAPRAAATITRAATTTIVEGLSEIDLSRYDAIVLDQYGVLHNGGLLLDGCADALERLVASGKKLVVLSNTSKRRAALVGELPGRGFRAEWLTDAICSGEICHEALSARAGASAIVFGWTQRSAAEYLDGSGVALAASVDDADLLVGYGPDTISTSSGDAPIDFRRSGDLAPFKELFEAAAAKNLPMLCANPDLVSVDGADGSLLYMPGKYAEYYESLGGPVVLFGKPGAAHFAAALQAAGVSDPTRALHVGDSLAHDILGAATAGLDSLFVVETGIHASDIDALTSDAVTRLASEEGVPAPTFAISKFGW
mmetsp:Transcript_8867/g.26664  ORF Transcript_8867/g.26664 Transcript_8867/m.26664 type:complete len:423 (-) Transcript_8867:104-1372(-)